MSERARSEKVYENTALKVLRFPSNFVRRTVSGVGEWRMRLSALCQLQFSNFHKTLGNFGETFSTSPPNVTRPQHLLSPFQLRLSATELKL